MKFKEFDTMMRQYEISNNLIPPLFYVILRLDGHAFHTLTDNLGFKKPFDIVFNSYMVKTSQQLMEKSPFNIKYAYTQSDEISLWLSQKDEAFKHKERKLLSVIAGYAASYFTYFSDEPCSFDNRILVFPSLELVVDYFRWRQADAGRNALNSWCFWTLVLKGRKTKNQANKMLHKKDTAFKHDLLFEYGINYNDLPTWQKRGVGLYWDTFTRTGFNPITRKEVLTQRRKIITNEDLPKGDQYSSFLIVKFINNE